MLAALKRGGVYYAVTVESADQSNEGLARGYSKVDRKGFATNFRNRWHELHGERHLDAVPLCMKTFDSEYTSVWPNLVTRLERDRLEPKPPVIRYEKARPGEMIHINIKSLGRIEGVGHRITGQHALYHRARGIGYEHLHVAIDDASRLAYTEVLPSLGREDATAFLNRAIAWFARLG